MTRTIDEDGNEVNPVLRFTIFPTHDMPPEVQQAARKLLKGTDEPDASTEGHTVSDPILLDAFRRQCINFGPRLALLAWRGQDGVDDDDLINIVKEFDRTDATP